MKKRALASRYAKALLLLAQSEGKTDEYAEEMRRFMVAFEEDSEIKKALLSPIFDAVERKRIVREMADLLTLSRAVRNFLQILIAKERMGEIKSIFEAYRNMADEIAGRVRVKIRSATTIPPNLFAKIREQVQRMVKKEVILEVEIQPDLIGGLVAQINNILIDGSVRGQIVRLREKLESALGGD